jgi:putative sterol carrier protein
MARTAREIIENHKFQENEPILRDVRGSYLFEIEQVGSWFVSVDRGKVSVDPAKHQADCVISCNEQDFVDFVEGRRNLVTALMQGRVQVQGDMALAQKFHRLVSMLSERRRGAA